MWRTRFFFALKKEAEIYRGLHTETPESIECREHGGDRSLVVAGRAGEKAPFRIDRFRVAPINIVACVVTHDRLPWFTFPLGDIDRLSIVVGVECNRSFRIWHCEIRDYDRRRTFYRKQFDHQASLLAHRADRFRIASDVRHIVRQVRDREDLSEFRQDFAFVTCSPGSRISGHRCRISLHWGVEHHEEQVYGESDRGILPKTHKA